MKKLFCVLCVALSAIVSFAAIYNESRAEVVVSINPNSGAFDSVIYSSSSGTKYSNVDVFATGSSGNRVSDYGFQIGNADDPFSLASSSATTRPSHYIYEDKQGNVYDTFSLNVDNTNSQAFASGWYIYKENANSGKLDYVTFNRTYDWATEDAILVSTTITNVSSQMITEELFMFDTFDPNQGKNISGFNSLSTYNDVNTTAIAGQPLAVVSIDDGTVPLTAGTGLTFVAGSGGSNIFLSSGDGNYLTNAGQLQSMVSAGAQDGDNTLSNTYTSIMINRPFVNGSTPTLDVGESLTLSILYTFGDDADSAIQVFEDYADAAYVSELGWGVAPTGTVDGDLEETGFQNAIIGNDAFYGQSGITSALASGADEIIINAGTYNSAIIPNGAIEIYTVEGNADAATPNPVRIQYIEGGLGSIIDIGYHDAGLGDLVLESGSFDGTIIGSSDLIKDASGTLALNGVTSLTGAVRVFEGTMNVNNVLSTPSLVVGKTDGTSVAAVYNHNGIVDSLNVGTLTVNPGGLFNIQNNQTVGTAILNGGQISGEYDGVSSYSVLTSLNDYDIRSGQVLSDVILAGDVDLNKTTGGTATLFGKTTYTGKTVVSDGTLQLSHAEAISGTSSVTVGSAGTLQISENITIDVPTLNDGFVTIDNGKTLYFNDNTVTGAGDYVDTGYVVFMDGSTYAPGNSTNPTVEVNMTNAEFKAGSTIAMDIFGITSGAAGHDRVNFTDTVNFTGSTLSVNANVADIDRGTAYKIFDYTSSPIGTFGEIDFSNDQDYEHPGIDFSTNPPTTYKWRTHALYTTGEVIYAGTANGDENVFIGGQVFDDETYTTSDGYGDPISSGWYITGPSNPLTTDDYLRIGTESNTGVVEIYNGGYVTVNADDLNSLLPGSDPNSTPPSSLTPPAGTSATLIDNANSSSYLLLMGGSKNGAQLEVIGDFDADIPGFIFHSGTIRIHGNLTDSADGLTLINPLQRVQIVSDNGLWAPDHDVTVQGQLDVLDGALLDMAYTSGAYNITVDGGVFTQQGVGSQSDIGVDFTVQNGGYALISGGVATVNNDFTVTGAGSWADITGTGQLHVTNDVTVTDHGTIYRTGPDAQFTSSSILVEDGGRLNIESGAANNIGALDPFDFEIATTSTNVNRTGAYLQTDGLTTFRGNDVRIGTTTNPVTQTGGHLHFGVAGAGQRMSVGIASLGDGQLALSGTAVTAGDQLVVGDGAAGTLTIDGSAGLYVAQMNVTSTGTVTQTTGLAHANHLVVDPAGTYTLNDGVNLNPHPWRYDTNPDDGVSDWGLVQTGEAFRLTNAELTPLRAAYTANPDGDGGGGNAPTDQAGVVEFTTIVGIQKLADGITSGTIRTGSPTPTYNPTTDPAVGSAGVGLVDNVSEPVTLSSYTRLEVADTTRTWPQSGDEPIQVSGLGSEIGLARFSSSLTMGENSVLAIDLDPSRPGEFGDTGWWDVAQATASDTLQVADGQALTLDGTLDLRALSRDWARGQEFNILDFDLAANDADEDGYIDSHFDSYIVPYLHSDGYAILHHEELLDGQDYMLFLGETGEGLDGYLRWDFSDLYSQGIIRVVPEPATWLMAGLAMMGLFLYRRRRNREK